ncbi:hypothetical protein K503DRAFT_853083 [Rhizopogon vinicolor AM-OR11-026]|uniref:R3H domain protein n=1 Tax=Rhizopogon vinicolor AM-OR11-026 TaxID=1314800 RepID=A0A1B7NG52_9AGAM|nr:hypothetical protein K503DRAFT_853083 [Rhizopogon vinicolor AM-OR11-026]
MTSSPTPDIGSLSLNPQSQRLHDTYDYDQSALHRQPYQFSQNQQFSGQSQYNPLGMSPSPLKVKPIRAGLPTQWLDNSMVIPDNRPLSPNNNSDFSSSGSSPPLGHITVPSLTPTTPSQNPDDEVIPTAIVVKNIPFNVKRETLLDIIASLSIPTPYAFNYHLDQQGSFRGLAFANFRQAADADAVVAALNGFDVQGRKLRVEYKKVLQAGEKERIEREKAIRRMRSMQLEKEQLQAVHQPYDDFPVTAPAFTPQRSFSSGAYQQQQYSPPPMPHLPISQPFNPVASPPVAPATPNPSEKCSSSNELDLNDPSTLEIYSRILLFKDDRMRDELAFSRTLSPKQRRVVHLIAQKLGVYHYSVGEGDERYAVVTRIDPNRTQRVQPATLSRAPSAYLSSSQPMIASSLRMKKSMPDMKTLHSQAPRLTSRASNGNIREGYATIASPSRRSPGGFGSLFGNFGSSAIPPVPSLPSSVTGSMNGGGMNDGGGSVVRQPRGPGVGGFLRRTTNSDQARGSGLEARSHEPLEI